MSFQIEEATRVGVNPLIGLYAESGCGKTFSALLLARGFVGPSGSIGVIDTENRRASLYADVPEVAPFQSVNFSEPFAPNRYIEAIELVESKFSIGIIDSGSHEWEGVGGINDMAILNEEKSGRTGLHNWRIPKIEHQKFVARLMRSKIPWIICLRAKFKTRQKKDERGKTQIVKDDCVSAIQSEDFLFEMTVHGEIMPDHSFRLTKHSHPSLKTCFPDGQPITVEHGKALAQWCKGGSRMAPAAPVDQPYVTAKKRLCVVLKAYKTAEEMEAWLVANAIIPAGTKLGTLTTDQLNEAHDKAKIVLAEGAQ
jgi:hypothetical protein